MRDLYVALTTGMSDEEKKQFAKELKAVVVGMQPGGEGHPSITRKTIPGRLKHAEEQIMKVVCTFCLRICVITDAIVIRSCSSLGWTR